MLRLEICFFLGFPEMLSGGGAAAAGDQVLPEMILWVAGARRRARAVNQVVGDAWEALMPFRAPLVSLYSLFLADAKLSKFLVCQDAS